MIEDVGRTVRNYITRVGTLVHHSEIQQLRTVLDFFQRARVVDHSALQPSLTNLDPLLRSRTAINTSPLHPLSTTSPHPPPSLLNPNPIPTNPHAIQTKPAHLTASHQTSVQPGLLLETDTRTAGVDVRTSSSTVTSAGAWMVSKLSRFGLGRDRDGWYLNYLAVLSRLAQPGHASSGLIRWGVCIVCIENTAVPGTGCVVGWGEMGRLGIAWCGVCCADVSELR
jgi:hypothetical protein